MQSIFERICPHHSWTSSSPITTLKQMKPSEKPELTAQVHSWWMELEARQSQQGVITCAICFWMQFVRACIFWPSGHTAWAIYSPRHLLGNRNRISNRFPRGMPWFGRYLGNYITKKANYFKKKKKKKKEFENKWRYASFTSNWSKTSMKNLCDYDYFFKKIYMFDL